MKHRSIQSTVVPPTYIKPIEPMCENWVRWVRYIKEQNYKYRTNG